MEKRVRKAFSGLLALALVLLLAFTPLPVTAQSAEGEPPAPAVVILSFDALAQTAYEVALGTALDDIGLPAALAVSIQGQEGESAATVENVTWSGDYQAEQAAVYTLTAAAEGYGLAEGLAWPSVAVTVLPEEQEPEPELQLEPEPEPEPELEPDEIDALIAAIDDLPPLDDSAAELDDEEAFAAWLAEQQAVYAQAPFLYDQLALYADDEATLERIGWERAEQLTQLYTLLFDAAPLAETPDNTMLRGAALMADDLDNWTAYAAAGFASGGGTSGDPYIITTPAQLAYLANQVNVAKNNYDGAYFQLGANINLSAHYWTPIGHDKGNFKGSFDGADYTIYGMNVDTVSVIANTGWINAGFFGVADDATITNVNLVGARINVVQTRDLTATTGGETMQVGGIGGYICNSDVTDCSFKGAIYAKFAYCEEDDYYVWSSNIYIGGIVGRTYRNTSGYGSNFTNCAAFGSIVAESRSVPNRAGVNRCVMGGIGGETSWGGSGEALMTSCYANSTLTNNTTGREKAYVGGVVGNTNMKKESSKMYYRYPNAEGTAFGNIESGLKETAATYCTEADMKLNMRRGTQSLPNWNRSDDVNDGYPIPAALYGVTYDLQGGEGTAAGKAAFGYPLTLPTPTRDGYRFTGWYDAAEDGTEYSGGEVYLLSQGITLYACWECLHASVATDAAVSPTCTTTGLTAGTHCSACGEILTAQETVAALGHDMVTDAAVAATCTKTGLTAGSHCSRCEDATTAQTEIAMLAHTPTTDAAVPATCTATGLTAGSHCSVCQEVLVAQTVVKALDHDYATAFTVDTPAACTEAGSQSKHCSRCDSRTEITPIPALTHAWGEWKSNNNGTETCTCTRDPSHTQTRNSKFSISYAGMEGATPGANQPTAHTYGAATTVPDPTRPGYTFAGWQVNGGAAVKGLTLAAHGYLANLTLTATWTPLPATAPALSGAAPAAVTYGYTRGADLGVSFAEAEGHTYSYAWYAGDSAMGDAISVAASYTFPTNLSAGEHEYTVRVTARRTDNSRTAYDDHTFTVTVDPAKVTVPPAAQSLVYSGSSQTGVAGGALYTVTDGAKTDAGEYTATVALRDKANYVWAIATPSSSDQRVAWSIAAQETAVSWGSDTSWVYDGTAHAPTANASGVKGETITLSVSDGEKNYRATPYTATATIASVSGGQAKADNYTLTGASQAFTITQKQLTVSAKPQTVAYGESIATGTAQVVASALANGDTLDSVTLAASDLNVATAGKTISPSAAVIKNGGGQDVSGNYNVAYVNAELTVTPRPLRVSVKENLTITKVYDGDSTVDGDKSAWLVITGLQNGEIATAAGTWAYESASAGASKTVNVTDVSISYNGTAAAANYSYSAAPLTTGGAITAATPRADDFVYAPPTELTYSSESKTASVQVKASITGMGKITVRYYTEGGSEVQAPTDAGTYSVKIDVTAGANYAAVTALTDDSWTFAIAKASNSIMGLSCANVTFGGTPAPSARAGFGTVSYAYSSKETGPYAAWSKSNGVGTWYVKAAVSGTANYAGVEAVTSFAVTAAQLTKVSVSGYSGVYDGNSHNAHQTTAATAVNEQPVTWQFGKTKEICTLAQISVKDVADSTTYYYRASAPHHADASGSFSVSISAKDIAGASVTLGAPLTYSGAAQAQTVAGVSIDGLAADYTVADNAGTEAKGYTLTVSGKGNFSGTQTKGFSIAPLPVKLIWEYADPFIYNGSAQDVTARVSNRAGNDTFSLVYEENSRTNAGSYTAAVTELGNDNYTLTGATNASLGWKIAPAPISFTVTGSSHGYDGGEKTAIVAQTANETPTIGADKFSVSYKLPEEDISEATASKSAAGVYEVLVTLKDHNFRFSGEPETTRVLKVGALSLGPAPATVLWQNTTAVYNGNQQRPLVSLSGVAAGDEGKVSVVSGAGDAGTHTLTAALTGDAANNYTLTNPTATFVIQPAPVAFTVSNDSARQDGRSHAATVSAMACGQEFTAFTVSYRDSRGNTLAAPTAAGRYAIYAGITDPNYRHGDAADGAARQIGLLTIYNAVAPALYTLSFDANGGAGAMDALPAAQAETVRTLPLNGFIYAGRTFSGWEYNGSLYQPGESLSQPSRNITLKAQWAEQVYAINGVVNADGSPAAAVVVTLMLGSRQVAETVTAANGTYSFANVLPGLYNLVAAKDGIIQTILVEIKSANAENQNVTLPAHRTNSLVRIAAGTPAIVVGQLENCFLPADEAAAAEGGSVELRLTAAVSPPEQQLEAAAGGQVGLYLEVELTKTVTKAGEGPVVTTLPQAPRLLELVVSLPGELQGKDGYTVYRLHDGQVQTLTTRANGEGEYISVNPEKTAITVYAKYFSAYAIAYRAVDRSHDRKATYPPIITPTLNGQVSVAPEYPERGATVTVTVTPNAGFAADTVRLTDATGKEIPASELVNGRLTFTQPNRSVTVTVSFKGLTGLPFTDVGQADWFHGDVAYVYEQGLLQGVDASLFGPYLTVTRGMLVAILYRLEGCPAVAGDCPFDDVQPGSYYQQAIAWAAANRIVEGYGNNKFGPDHHITRQQLAAILYRYAQYKGYETSAAMGLAGYEDAAQISAYAVPAMEWACGCGLLQGAEGKLSPQANAQRCQVAAMLRRFCEALWL